MIMMRIDDDDEIRGGLLRQPRDRLLEAWLALIKSYPNLQVSMVFMALTMLRATRASALGAKQNLYSLGIP